jgi:hypothetical protein
VSRSGGVLRFETTRRKRVPGRAGPSGAAPGGPIEPPPHRAPPLRLCYPAGGEEFNPPPGGRRRGSRSDRSGNRIGPEIRRGFLSARDGRWGRPRTCSSIGRAILRWNYTSKGARRNTTHRRTTASPDPGAYSRARRNGGDVRRPLARTASSPGGWAGGPAAARIGPPHRTCDPASPEIDPERPCRRSEGHDRRCRRPDHRLAFPTGAALGNGGNSTRRCGKSSYPLFRRAPGAWMLYAFE